MTKKRSRLFAVLFVCLMTLSVFAPAVGAAETSPDTASSSVGTTDAVEPSEKIHSALEDTEGTREVIVRLESADLDASASRAEAVSQLRRQAETSQQRIVDFAAQHEGVTVENRFWLTNAVLLSVDTDEVSLDEFARMNAVTDIHPNFNVEVPRPERSSVRTQGTTEDGYNTTYGLDQVNATEVWDEYDTMGEGAKVAVLDTGVDASHPDIDLYTENASDSTYPGGWAEFDDSGNQVPGSEPHDTDQHGTHTSGTVAGGNASGEYIGVAPNADLMHGLVLPSGGGSFAQIIGGMEWAVQEDADIISMSLGAGGYYSQMIEPVQNARNAGTIVVASSSNSGQGTSGTPGNVFESVAVGASNENYGIAGFSSGETIVTDEAWGSAAPEEWPDEYVIPDIAAPGVSVKSSVPGGDYAQFDGTSMAAPHTAGTLALMVSAAGGAVDPATAENALYTTAWKPDDAPDEQDDRYGRGLIDASAATDYLTLDSGVEGTVTDQSGNPVEGATVTLDGGTEATTDASGQYSHVAPAGDHELTVEAFGYETATQTVTVQEGTYTTADIALTPALEVTLESGQDSAIEGGSNTTVTATVANADTVTVELTGDYDAANATLTVNGEEAAFGEAVSVADGTVSVSVETAENTSGQFSLTHTFAGAGDSQTVTTGPTVVVEEFTDVGVVDTPNGQFGDDTVAVLDANLPAEYNVERVTTDEALDVMGDYDAFVVQKLPTNDSYVQTFVDETAGMGVVYLDHWGSDSNAIPRMSAATGSPASTGQAWDGSTTDYVVQSDHAIFDSVAEVGDNVSLHDASYNDHSWFSGYEGTTLANLHNGDTVKGTGLAVDESTLTVLASSLGRETYVGNDDFTEDADQILANAVVWTATADDPEGTVDVTETTVQPGESGTVTVHAPDLEDVSGYQAMLTFDPAKLQVTGISGVDFADPVVDVDNDAGTISMAQAQANGVDSPEFVAIEFDVLMDDYGQTANVSWTGEESMVTYPSGTAPLVDWTDGAVETADCMAGDVNMDGTVTVQDATLVQQAIVGQEPTNYNSACADMNGDGATTSADVTLILEDIVGNSVATPQTVSDLVGAQFHAEA